MPRRVTPFQVRIEIYVRSQLARGRSANDVAREDLEISPAMLADYRSGDSLPNRCVDVLYVPGRPMSENTARTWDCLWAKGWRWEREGR